MQPRHWIALPVSAALLATACGTLDQQVQQAAEEIVATSLAATAIAQTLTAPTAAPIVITATPEPGGEVVPTPGVDTTALSEEELAAAVEVAVASALAESAQASSATAEAAADGSVTEEEVVTLQVEVSGAEEALAAAEALLVAYEAQYGAYVEESLDLLAAVESDLAAIEADLNSISVTLAQGSAAASAAAAQLQAAAAQASASAEIAQAEAQSWASEVQSKREGRAEAALSVPPTGVASSLPEAIQSAGSYVDTVRNSLADGLVSREELQAIAQSGANASAGLQAQGGPQAQGLADGINQMTAQVARGDVPAARANFAGLEAQFQGLPQR